MEAPAASPFLPSAAAAAAAVHPSNRSACACTAARPAEKEHSKGRRNQGIAAAEVAEDGGWEEDLEAAEAGVEQGKERALGRRRRGLLEELRSRGTAAVAEGLRKPALGILQRQQRLHRLRKGSLALAAELAGRRWGSRSLDRVEVAGRRQEESSSWCREREPQLERRAAPHQAVSEHL